jgi:hypothetical protein
MPKRASNISKLLLTSSKKELKQRENNRFGLFWQGKEKTKEKR